MGLLGRFSNVINPQVLQYGAIEVIDRGDNKPYLNNLKINNIVGTNGV